MALSASSAVQQRLLAGRLDEHHRLVHPLGRRRDRGHRDLDGVGEQPVGEFGDLARHGGGEEQRLALGRDHCRQLADVVDEAHVEHLVGLVEDEDLHVRQHDSALVDEVEQPAGRGDEDVDAIGHVADLLADATRRRTRRSSSA